MDKPNVLSDIQEGYYNKLKNRLFGLLCEREKDRDWEKFLDAILIELLGWPEEQRTINYLSLFYNLSSLRFLDYKMFRKTIFTCMDILGKGGFENG